MFSRITTGVHVRTIRHQGGKILGTHRNTFTLTIVVPHSLRSQIQNSHKPVTNQLNHFRFYNFSSLDRPTRYAFPSLNNPDKVSKDSMPTSMAEQLDKCLFKAVCVATGMTMGWIFLSGTPNSECDGRPKSWNN